MSYWALYAVSPRGARTLDSLHSFRGSAIERQRRLREFDKAGWHSEYVIEHVTSIRQLGLVLATAARSERKAA